MRQIEFEPPRDSGPKLFVAYEATPRKWGNPETGEATELRPSTFVREYPSIQVAKVELKTSRGGGEDFQLGTVTFEARSVQAAKTPLTNDFTAHFKPEEGLAEFLQHAKQTGTAVWVAIETIRRPKQRGTDQQVPVEASIHELRGATADGKKADIGASGANCKNLLVAVGTADRPDTVRFTDELRSDPTEWGQLRRNNDATLPPRGWRVCRGGIIPTSGGTDIEAIATRVVELLGASATSSETASPVRPPQRNSHSIEGKPWEPWNSDGRVNLGSYLASRYRFEYTTAMELIADNVELSPSDRMALAWELSTYLLTMADAVQTQAGFGPRPDRGARSHREASQWIRYVFTDLAIMPGFGACVFASADFKDPKRREEWASLVVSTAAFLMRRGAQAIEMHLTVGESSPSEASQPETAQAGQAAAVEQPQAPIMVSDDPDTLSRYAALLALVGQSEHPDRFLPLLRARFASDQPTHIQAAPFREALASWEHDPGSFLTEAHGAWAEAAQVLPVSA